MSDAELEKAQQFIHCSISESTLKGYNKCWEDFVAYCKEKNQDPYRCEVPTVMKYLVQKGTNCGVSRLYVYLSAISHQYRSTGRASPCDDTRIKMMMKGKLSIYQHKIFFLKNQL